MSVTAPDGTVWPPGSLRALEHTSIREFVQRAADDGYLSGRVLDYGAGRMPYASIIQEAGGVYEAFDRTSFPASNAEADLNPSLRMKAKAWDTILLTQVMQYIPHTELPNLIAFFYRLLRPSGHFVGTGKTNWPEVQKEDLGGITMAGVKALLEPEGFAIERLENRASVVVLGENFSLGWGVVARRPTCIIYALIDPQNGEPRYVGQTEVAPRDRLRAHMNDSQRSEQQKRPLVVWLRSLEGQRPKMKILEHDPVDSNEAERRWYLQFAREGADLVNSGIGNKGRRTKPTKRRPMSEEGRKKVSEFFRGRPKTPQSNILRSIAHSQRPHLLTEEQVREIRSSDESNASLAKKFGVNRAVVFHARRGDTYKWVR